MQSAEAALEMRETPTKGVQLVQPLVGVQDNADLSVRQSVGSFKTAEEEITVSRGPPEYTTRWPNNADWQQALTDSKMRAATAPLQERPPPQALDLPIHYKTHPQVYPAPVNVNMQPRQPPHLLPHLLEDPCSSFGSPYPVTKPNASQNFDFVASPINAPEMLHPSARDEHPTFHAALPAGDGRNSRQLRSTTNRPTILEETNSRPESIKNSPQKTKIKREPEICVECLMRDRDMADVDVSGPQIWARASDADYFEALAAEQHAEADFVEGSAFSHRTRSRQSQSASRRSRDTLGNPVNGTESEESGAPSSGQSVEYDRVLPRRRRYNIDARFASPLSMPNLALWTSMNISATSHRWKTLQQYLIEQAYYLELGSRGVSSEERMPAQLANGESAQPPNRQHLTNEHSQIRVNHRLSNRTIPFENPAPDEATRSPYLASGYSSSNASLNTGVARTRLLPLAARRLSSPMPDLPSHRPRPAINETFNYSASDVSRSFVPGRPPSISRSVNDRDRRRTGLWSTLGKSPATSTFSLLTNGSMLDMHIGLDMDRALPALPYDPVRQVMADSSVQSASTEKPKKERKKKGIRKFLSRLFDSRTSHASVPAPMPLHPPAQHLVSPGHSPALEFDDPYEPLEPPFPSFIAAQHNRQGHDRSSSISSQSSSPHSPRDSYRPQSVSIIDSGSPGTIASTSYFGRTDQVHYSHRAGADDGSLLRMKTSRSQDILDSLYHSRAESLSLREKDLPPIPPRPVSTSSKEDDTTPTGRPLDIDPLANCPPPLENGLYHDTSPTEEIGGGKRAKAKSASLFSLPFKRQPHNSASVNLDANR